MKNLMPARFGALLILFMAVSISAAYSQRIETVQSVAGDGDGGINSTATVVKVTSTPTGGTFSLPTSETDGRSVTIINLTGAQLNFDQVIIRDAALSSFWTGMSASADVMSPTIGPNVITIMFDSYFWRAIR